MPPRVSDIQRHHADAARVERLTGGGYAQITPAIRLATEQIFFGKPKAAWTSGTTVTLDPCDAVGEDNGQADATVYLLASQASDSIENATIAGSSQGVTCSLTTSTIVAYIRGVDGEFYVLGTKMQVLTEFRYYASDPTFALQCKVRFDWGLFFSSESDWENVTTNMSKCPA